MTGVLTSENVLEYIGFFRRAVHFRCKILDELIFYGTIFMKYFRKKGSSYYLRFSYGLVTVYLRFIYGAFTVCYGLLQFVTVCYGLLRLVTACYGVLRCVTVYGVLRLIIILCTTSSP